MDPEEQQELTYTPNTPGLREEGNIDLHSRPILHNPDGSISTVRSMSFGTPQGEVLIPTVGPQGQDMSEDEAIQHYQRTGEHLGIFSTPEDATRYAQDLHTQQAREYLPQAQRASERHTEPTIIPREDTETPSTPPPSERQGERESRTSRYRLLNSEGHAVEVNPQEAQEGLASGHLRTSRPLRMRHSDGTLYEIPADEVAGALSSGRFVLDTPDDQQARRTRRSLQSAPLQGVTAAASLLRGADFGTGLSEALIERPLGIHEDIEALREANPDIATASEIGGNLLTVLPSGGESLLGRGLMAPGRAVLRAGERLGARTTSLLAPEGAGLARRLAARTLGGVVEGGTQAGLAEGSHILTEAAFGEDPGDISDRLAMSVGLGGLVGGAAHGVGALIHEGAGAAARTGRATADMIARQFQTDTGQVLEPGLASLAEGAVRRAIPLSQMLSGDVDNVVPRLFGDGGQEARRVLIGGQNLRDEHIRRFSQALSETARAEEVLERSLHGPRKTNAIEAIVDTANAPEQYQVSQQLLGDVRRLSDNIDMSARTYGSTGEFGPRAGLLSERLRDSVSRAEDEIQHALSSEAPHVRSAEIFSSIDSLRRQVGNLVARMPERVPAVESAFNSLRSTLENEQLWGRAATLQRETNEALHRQITWSRDFERMFMRPGESQGFERLLEADTGRVSRHLNGAGNAANESNERVAQQYMRATSDLADSVIRNRGSVLGESALQAAEHLKGASQRLQEIYDTAARDIRLQNQAAELERGSLGSFMAGGIGNAIGGPVLGAAAIGLNILSNPVRTARMLGTIERMANDQNNQIVGAVRAFLGRAQEAGHRAISRAQRVAETSERAAYTGAQAYTRRINELNRYRDPNVLARDIHESTQHLADSAPRVQENLQASAVRGIQYLLSQEPRGFILNGTIIPEHHLPPNAEMQRFLRVARTVDHPKTVLAELKNRTLTPESVQALRTVYPRLYTRILSTVTQELAEGGKAPGYQDRIQLGILFGIPTDPSLTPQNINIFQQSHQANAQAQLSGQLGTGGAPRPGRRGSSSGGALDMASSQASASEQIEFRRSR